MTTTRTVGSDTLVLGLLGLAALCAVGAAFFNRIREISFAGWDFKFVAHQAAQAVARRSGDRAVAVTDAIRRGQSPPERWAPLLILAARDEAADPKETQKPTEMAAAQAGEATALTMQYADTLARAARSSPDQLQTLADAWGINREELAPLLIGGDIPPKVWDQLADRALREVG